MVMTLDLRVMDFTNLGKVSNACAMYYIVMFQIVFASLHQAVLSKGGVKCYALKLYHPPQYYGQHDMTSQ